MQGADFSFNHSEGFSRWPPKQGVLMLMVACQIAGLQIKLHIQQIFDYKPTKCITTKAVFFHAIYGFKTSWKKNLALKFPTIPCTLCKNNHNVIFLNIVWPSAIFNLIPIVLAW